MKYPYDNMFYTAASSSSNEIRIYKLLDNYLIDLVLVLPYVPLFYTKILFLEAKNLIIINNNSTMNTTIYKMSSDYRTVL